MTTRSQSTKIRVGERIAIKYAKGGRSTALELGEVKEIRRGIPRTIVIAMADGSTIYLFAETPRPSRKSEAIPPESPERD